MPLSFRYRYLSDDRGRDWRSLRRPDPIKPATDAHIGAQAVSASARAHIATHAREKWE